MSFTSDHLTPVLKLVNKKRFFNTERGYQGEILALLHKHIRENKLFPEETIIEQEYQKTQKHHSITQRPDLIIHIPIEAGITDNRKDNNFYVIALKFEGNEKAATEDFNKLDEMFDQLSYPEGVFINISAYPNTYLSKYNGEYKDRIHEISIGLRNDSIQLHHCHFNGEGVLVID